MTTATDDIATIAIHLPHWMLDDLRVTAEAKGTTVTEHIRRCVSLDKHIWGQDPGACVEVHYIDGRVERIRNEP